MAMELLTITLPSVAAALGTTVYPIGEVPMREAEGTFNIERCVIIAPAAVTGNNTNSGTLNIRQLRAGTPVTTLATLALVAGINLTAEVSTVLTLTGTPQVQAGDILEAQYVQIGTGLALPAATRIQVEID